VRHPSAADQKALAARDPPVTGWLIPLVAIALWTGILLEPALGSAGPPSAAMALGVGLLVGAATWLPSFAHSGRFGMAIRPTRALLVRALVVFAAFLELGLGWSSLRAHQLASSYLVGLAPRAVTVDASLDADLSAGIGGWSGPAHVGLVRIGGPARDVVAVRAGVWLDGSGRIPRASWGDRARVEGQLVHPKMGPFATYLRRRGIATVLRVRSFTRVGPAASPLVRAGHWTRRELASQLRRLFSRRDAGLLMGLALGDGSMLDARDESHFKATGLQHLLVVSGENVAMVLAPILGLALVLRLSPFGRFLLGASSVVSFVVLTGAGPSVLRAGVMALLTLMAVLLGRPTSSVSALSGAVMILLAADPTLAWQVGFQLSVAATAGIVALAVPIAGRLAWLPRPVAVAASTTLAAQIGTSPLLLFYFHAVPVVTLLANLLAFPSVSPAMLFGLAAAGAGAIWRPLGIPFAALSAPPLHYLEGVAGHLASAPLPWITSGGGPAPLVGGVVILVLLTWRTRTRAGAGDRLVPRPALIVLAFVIPLFVWSSALRAGLPSQLEVRFFDVGQGDAALVRSPGGVAILIDGGPDPNTVVTKLERLGIKRLDAVVATHPHLDHFVGLPAVLARIQVSVVFDSGCQTPESDSPPYREFLRAVRDEGIPERHPVAGEVIVVGDVRLEVLSPDRCWHDTNSDPNNDSLVLLLTYREDSVLFANEPEGPAQKAMLDSRRRVSAMVLNVPHHGAGTSIPSFFQAVHARVAVVSVGPNRYGHPVPRTLEWLRSTGASVVRTDQAGDVVIRFEGLGLTITTDRSPPLEGNIAA
jgi:competence protein ComEC